MNRNNPEKGTERIRGIGIEGFLRRNIKGDSEDLALVWLVIFSNPKYVKWF